MPHHPADDTWVSSSVSNEKLGITPPGLCEQTIDSSHYLELLPLTSFAITELVETRSTLYWEMKSRGGSQ